MSTVLIVDDSSADRILFRTILTRAGYTVQEVGKGSEALAAAASIRPHAIVLDVNLPDMDGHEVCRALKTNPELAGIPVLMLTVRDNDADVLAGLEAGADDYVAKDSASGIVLARLRRLIEFRQLATIAVLNEHLVQVGRLLAGIVHEIRGPLSVIRGSAELMRIQLAEDDPNQQWVEPILRGTKLLQIRLEHLMATVRSGPGIMEMVEVNPVVHESIELFLRGTNPRTSRVTISEQPSNPLPNVRVDAGRLIQVLLSLFSNAHEAISNQKRAGNIVVKTDKVVRDDGDWVTIEIIDDGPGIPESFLERIFEPFFTTKEAGSGYGLYMASEILKEQNGRLTAKNLPGGGACFTVWLPAALTDAPADS